MPWIQGYPYYLIMGSILSLYMGVKAYQFRKTPGRRYLWILMLLVSWIFAATAGEIMAISFGAKLWWKNLQQPPLFMSTIFTYAVIKDYVSRSTAELPRRLFLYSIPVFAYVLLIFTDSYHHLMRSEVGVAIEAGISGVMVQPTLLSMCLIAYDQLFGVYALYLLTASMWGAPKYYLRRNLLLLGGLLVPVASIFLLPILKITVTGFTAFTYLPATIAAYFTVFRDPYLALYPLDKNKIFENMKDGIVVIDPHDIIMDINENGAMMLSDLSGEWPSTWLGKNITPLLVQHTELAQAYRQRRAGEYEIEVAGPGGSYYGVSLIVTEPNELETTGILLVFSDQSQKKRYERELLHQATVDDLTGLYNRRHFMGLVQKHGLREGKGTALLLFDIDDFKLINDTYGHLAGDQALVDLSSKILSVYKDIGISGRVGGEEFAVCFFASSEAAALEEAEFFRTMIREHVVNLDGRNTISLTVSIGIAFTQRGDVTFETLYREADEALYLSKTTGKDKVTLGGQPPVGEVLKS
ncbi:histidine kinase N-terminal 7TM domain-containing diguanylate cyclase [Paenibacillus agri]|uniref:Diguanylate cyclase n=1 Tax=Paenibacillus agri TaxID=2744309 RepID=A0A850EYM3_9BACL|nr:diguanylate cyclase [Paenibacillus agri]NUU62931.1 diguanylate cyclase [Paenibacillus agri]